VAAGAIRSVVRRWDLAFRGLDLALWHSGYRRCEECVGVAGGLHDVGGIHVGSARRIYARGLVIVDNT
jgi:hypothetical protein